MPSDINCHKYKFSWSLWVNSTYRVNVVVSALGRPPNPAPSPIHTHTPQPLYRPIIFLKSYRIRICNVNRRILECTLLLVHLKIDHHQKYRKTWFDDEQSNEMFFVYFLQRQVAQNPKLPPILAQKMVHDIKAALIKWLRGGNASQDFLVIIKF